MLSDTLNQLVVAAQETTREMDRMRAENESQLKEIEILEAKLAVMQKPAANDWYPLKDVRERLTRLEAEVRETKLISSSSLESMNERLSRLEELSGTSSKMFTDLITRVIKLEFSVFRNKRGK